MLLAPLQKNIIAASNTTTNVAKKTNVASLPAVPIFQQKPIQKMELEDEQTIQAKLVTQLKPDITTAPPPTENNDSNNDNTSQLKELEEEMPLQGKFIVQKKELEDKLPMQAKFIVQKKDREEEQPVQGKFIIQQKDQEEQKPIQPKFKIPSSAPTESKPYQRFAFPTNNEPEALKAPIQRFVLPAQPIQKKVNNTGMPDNLKAGIENNSGFSMDDVKVHYNSDKPALLQAHAYAQGTDIHIGPGQEKHLPHEAWHVVQQKQGRVKPTLQQKGIFNVNDDIGLEKEADVMGEKSLSSVKTVRMNVSGDYPTVTLHSDTKQFARGNKKSKHNRKNLRDAKLRGEHYSESIVTNEPEVESEEVVEHVSKKEVAETFSKGLVEEGITTYLSGGGALGFQGGSRPISDLDFRVSSSTVGFTSFNEPKGVAVLKYINQVILSNDRTSHKISGAVINEFHPIGDDALTIGTDNWFGIEVSLSVVPSQQETVKLSGNESTPGIAVLSLEEIMSDKLKTMITRTKKGQDSVKKVSQDLFDFLETIQLINATTETGAKPVGEHLQKAIFSRMGEYIVANLEGIQLYHLSEKDLFELINARTILTSQAHIKNGARKKAFQALTSKYNGEIAILVDKLGRTSIEHASKKKLRPWMQVWNDNPHFGPPKKGKPSRSAITKGKTKDTTSVEHLESIMPDNYLDDIVGKMDENAKTVYRILHLSGGFRPLADSKKSLETLEAFGLTKTQFSKAYKALKETGLVEGKSDGLHQKKQE